MVRPAEGSLTQLALERSVPCVFSLVSGEFIRPGKPPAATLPVTDVGLLPGVSAAVGLEVRGLGVGLAAVVVFTGVDDHLPPPQPPPTSLLDGHEAGWRLLRGQGGVERGRGGRETLAGGRAEAKVDIKIEVLVCRRRISLIEILRGVQRMVRIASRIGVAGVWQSFVAQVLVGGGQEVEGADLA